MIVGSRSAIAIASTTLLGACSSSVPLIGAGGTTEINAQDFVSSQPTVRPPIVREHLAQEEAGESVVAVSQAAVQPELTSGSGLIDAKVGDLNGRPIFAAEWLAPLSGRLVANAAQMEEGEWIATTSELIATRLNTELIEELMFTEARRSLNENQQAGLRFVLAEIQQTQIRRAGGSRTAAERALAEANNQTLDEFVRDQERILLVQEQLRTQIDDKIQVPWREIQLAYQRNADVYDPPPVMVFRQIRVRTDREERIAEVRNGLASGVPFGDLADSDVNETKDAREIEIPAEGEVVFSRNEQINALALSLAPGEWGGPIEVDTRTYWVQLAEVRRDYTSLYDAQLELEEQLRAEQRKEELSRYVARRVSRAGLEEFDRMVVELTAIAAEWYYHPNAPREPAEGP